MASFRRRQKSTSDEYHVCLLMSQLSKTSPVPAYGLAGDFLGVRWLEGESHDQCTMVHRRDQSQTDIIVGVDRRPVADSRASTSSALDRDSQARFSMAVALVVDLP